MDMATRRTTKTNKMTSIPNNDGGLVKEISPLEIANDDITPIDSQQSNNTTNNNDNDPSSTIDEKYKTEREQTKLRHWKESEYAAGLVEPTWADELETYRKRGRCCCCPDREAMGQLFQEEIDPGCGCTYLSAVICSRLGAGRIGNMAVLKERHVMVEVEEEDNASDDNDEGFEEVDGFLDEDSLHQRNPNSSKPNDNDKDNKNTTKKTKKRLVRKREIQLVVGPFWPMLLFVTYPLIFGVSALTLWSGLPGKPLYVQIVWALVTCQLIRSLFNTGFRDPGILTRHASPPPVPEDEESDGDNSRPRRRVGFRWGNEEGPWRWSDQAQTYRPRNSMYCPDCKVVIEEFDHTCPWTGTAIGKKNMGPFQRFVGLIFVCLIMDIFLLTAGAM
mmetsp:Transcript_4210/g.7478  ORF Transcript_4210/g.7478 Transcript_4210/m.7478 type:complete len:389 (-) Transcript_4210:331-1497(-)